jgi:hypothetical protein
MRQLLDEYPEATVCDWGCASCMLDGVDIMEDPELSELRRHNDCLMSQIGHQALTASIFCLPNTATAVRDLVDEFPAL